MKKGRKRNEWIDFFFLLSLSEWLLSSFDYIIHSDNGTHVTPRLSCIIVPNMLLTSDKDLVVFFTFFLTGQIPPLCTWSSCTTPATTAASSIERVMSISAATNHAPFRNTPCCTPGAKSSFFMTFILWLVDVDSEKKKSNSKRHSFS